jgi:hypothetical protein
MRPRRAGLANLGFMQTIRLCYPARQRIYWIQDNLSANWTPDIRAYAANNKIELVPTPTSPRSPWPDRECEGPAPPARPSGPRRGKAGRGPAPANGSHPKWRSRSSVSIGFC